MKLENKIYVYGFTLTELVFVLGFFILGLSSFLLSMQQVGLAVGFGIFICFVSAPIAFIKIFIHSKHEGYFINLVTYFLRPKFYLPVRNINNRRK